MALNPGNKLGPYEVLAPLGAGGMGEVYRARDSRLGRDVAIKVLPQHLSANSEVRARFEREARTVSSLNHPSICTLFDIGREGDTDYLVMELVDGETLAARLERDALPVHDVLKIGAQIADALDRAHRAGVVHRDLKPGNIMLTKSGAKLMDFGLARATGLGGPASTAGATAAMSHSPTMAQPLTAEGTIVGTFQYMAPEQLEGKETDARSDLWSFGCVLYEMVTGKRAFEGNTQASLISSIMRDEPRSMIEISPMSPPVLDRVVRQCLAKDPNDRWQSAGDLRRELEWISTSSSQMSAPAVGSGRRRGLSRRAMGAIAVAATIVAVAALIYAFLGSKPVVTSEAPMMRFLMEPPAGAVIQMPAEAALSPDGTMMAFCANDSIHDSQLYVRPLGSVTARVIPGSEGAGLPFWSPDGRYLAFFSDSKLRKVALDGGEPVVLCDAPDPRGGDWSPNGVIVFAPRNQGGIERVSANGGNPTPVTRVDAARGERGHRYPQFLPDGKHFLYVAIGEAEDVTTFATTADGADPVEICRAGSMGRWAPPGYLLYLDTGVNSPRRRLLAQRFDPGTLKVSGDAELVLDDVASSNFGYANAEADERGTLVVQHSSEVLFDYVWRDRSGRVVGTVASGMSNTVALSRDGTRLAHAGPRGIDLYVLDIASGVSTRLTFENKRVNSIYWSADGSKIAFSRLFVSGGWQVFVKPADGSGPDTQLFRGPGILNYAGPWTPDGKWLVAVCADSIGDFDLWKVPTDGSGKAGRFQHTREQEASADLSPDGHWVLSVTDDGGNRAMYVQSFPEPGAKYQVTVKDLAGGAWGPGGDAVLFMDQNRTLFSVQVSTQNGFRQGATTRLFRLPPQTSISGFTPRGDRFLNGTARDLSEYSRLEIVLGWQQLLGNGQ